MKTGRVFSRHSFGKVINDGGSYLTVENEEGFQWDVGKDIVEKEFAFADTFENITKASRTNIINIILDRPFIAMTIGYRKKIDPKVIAEQLSGGRGSLSQAQWLDLVKKAAVGEFREIIGYHQRGFDDHQRLFFKEVGVGLKLVDLRTVEYVVVNNQRYEKE